MISNLLKKAAVPLAFLVTSGFVHADLDQSYSVVPLTCPVGYSYPNVNGMNEKGQIVGTAVDSLGFTAMVIWNANGSVAVSQSYPYGYNPGININDNGWTIGHTDYFSHGLILTRDDRTVIKGANQNSVGNSVLIDNSNNVAFADGGGSYYLHAMVMFSATSKFSTTEDINGIVCPRISVDGNLYDGYSAPVGMNQHGQVLGFSNWAIRNHFWLYDIHSRDVTVLPDGYGFSSMNNSGQIVGWHGSGPDERTCIWAESTGAVDLPPVLPPYNTFPGDINDAGTVLNDHWTYDGTSYSDILDRVPMSPHFDSFVNRSFAALRLDNRGRVLVRTNDGAYLLIPSPRALPHPVDVSDQMSITYGPPRRDSQRTWHQKVTISTNGGTLSGPVYLATDGIEGSDGYFKASLLNGNGETWYYGTEATGIAARQGVIRIAGPNQSIGPDPITIHLSLKGLETGEGISELPFPTYTGHILQGAGRY